MSKTIQLSQHRTHLFTMGCIFILGCMVVCLTGCGGPATIYPARGTVSFLDGTKVTQGNISFSSKDDPTINAYAEIQADGTFVLSTYGNGDGAPAATYVVVVTNAELDDDDDAEPDDEDDDVARPSKGAQIPLAYGYPQQSGLEYTVTTDAETNVFHIKLDPAKPSPKEDEPSPNGDDDDDDDDDDEEE